MKNASSTETAKRRAALYLKVAESIANGNDYYIVPSLFGKSDVPHDRFAELFSETGEIMRFGQGFDNYEEGRNERVLALCFMAAIDGAGDA